VLKLFHVGAVLNERVNAFGVQLSTSEMRKCRIGVVVAPGVFVWALARKRVEYIGNGDDAYFDRDRIAAQAFRIAAAVDGFMGVLRDVAQDIHVLEAVEPAVCNRVSMICRPLIA
jgi:hypothetical protein